MHTFKFTILGMQYSNIVHCVSMVHAEIKNVFPKGGYGYNIRNTVLKYSTICKYDACRNHKVFPKGV